MRLLCAFCAQEHGRYYPTLPHPTSGAQSYPLFGAQSDPFTNGEVSSVLCSCGGRLSTFEACALFLREAEAADGSCVSSVCSYGLLNQMLPAFSAPFTACSSPCTRRIPCAFHVGRGRSCEQSEQTAL